MSVTDFGNWEMQAGDPAIFAFRLAFLPNPHGAEDRADDEVRTSWGSFTIWTRGENLCAHVEQGEVVDSAHWRGWTRGPTGGHATRYDLPARAACSLTSTFAATATPWKSQLEPGRFPAYQPNLSS